MSKQLLIFIGVFLPCVVWSQADYISEIRTWQEALDDSFRDPEESPLSKKDQKKFRGLTYYQIDTLYRVKATLIRTPNEPPFTIPTTTERLPVYTQFGLAIFTISGVADTLHLYESLQMSLSVAEEKHLFVPFTDLTSGMTSYGGGRYLDIDYPTSDSTIILDFNKAYNPYCAYSSLYSCPIPPRENDLALEIKAGVKDWKNSEH